MKNNKSNFSNNFALVYVEAATRIFPIIVIFLLLNPIINYYLNDKIKYLLTVDVSNLLKDESLQTYLKMLAETNSFPITIIALLYIATGYFLSIIIYLLFKTRKFLQNISANNDFSYENGKFLKDTSVIVLIMYITIITVREISKQYTVTSVQGDITFYSKLVEIGKVLYDPVLIISVLVFVIGNVIIRGVEIKQENDLTV